MDLGPRVVERGPEPRAFCRVKQSFKRLVRVRTKRSRTGGRAGCGSVVPGTSGVHRGGRVFKPPHITFFLYAVNYVDICYKNVCLKNKIRFFYKTRPPVKICCLRHSSQERVNGAVEFSHNRPTRFTRLYCEYSANKAVAGGWVLGSDPPK